MTAHWIHVRLFTLGEGWLILHPLHVRQSSLSLRQRGADSMRDQPQAMARDRSAHALCEQARLPAEPDPQDKDVYTIKVLQTH